MKKSRTQGVPCHREIHSSVWTATSRMKGRKTEMTEKWKKKGKQKEENKHINNSQKYKTTTTTKGLKKTQ